MINSLALIHPKLYKMHLAVDIAVFNVFIQVVLHKKYLTKFLKFNQVFSYPKQTPTIPKTSNPFWKDFLVKTINWEPISYLSRMNSVCFLENSLYSASIGSGTSAYWVESLSDYLTYLLFWTVVLATWCSRRS